MSNSRIIKLNRLREFVDELIEIIEKIIHRINITEDSGITLGHISAIKLYLMSITDEELFKLIIKNIEKYEVGIKNNDTLIMRSYIIEIFKINDKICQSIVHIIDEELLSSDEKKHIFLLLTRIINISKICII